jgi:hypothetical protein
MCCEERTFREELPAFTMNVEASEPDSETGMAGWK